MRLWRLHLSRSTNRVFEKQKISEGVREGQHNLAQSRDHSGKRYFKKDEDQKTFEAGEQKDTAIEVINLGTRPAKRSQELAFASRTTQ